MKPFLVLVASIVAAASAAAQTPCIALDITTGWVTVPHAPDLVPQGAISVEAWIWYDEDSPGPSSRRVIAKDPDAPDGSSWEIVVWDPRRLSIGIKTTSGFIYHEVPAFTVQVTPLVWHHVAFTHDGALCRIYFDGVQVDQFAAAGPLAPNTGPLRIGNGFQNLFHWLGRIDEIRVWSVVRTASQIASRRSFQIGWEPGLVADWRFNGDFHDSIGGHDGAAVGIVPFSASGAPLGVVLEAPASASIGSQLGYTIASPLAATAYLFDVSLAGSEPGVSYGSVPVPLNPPFLGLSYGGPWFAAFMGTTSAAGTAHPSVALPPEPALVGQTLSACYVTFAPGMSAVSTVGTPAATTLLGLAPQIASATPATGFHVGGTQVTLTGASFVPGATVRFAGVLAPFVDVTDGQHVACVAPPGVPGTAPITVTNPDGASTTATGLFTYVPGLELLLVYPAVAIHGTTVTVIGTGFQSGLSLAIGGTSQAPLAVTPTVVAFTTPANVPCSTQVVITNPDGQSASIPFNPGPQIFTTSMSSGSAAGGTSITITGTAFFPMTAVSVGGVPVVAHAQTYTSFTIVTPPGSAGPTVITVTAPSGCAASVPFAYE